ncbi:MAG: HipA N-terminal domain-containing protein [Blastocatellia bacterium]|nr:HipA N-terminal domain-containing protein [Blastocatellia bacterium]
MQAPPEIQAKFLLKYGDLLVGILSVADGIWKFEYSDQFKKDNFLRPIVEFPDLNKTYESPELWQFFAARIPSPEQSDVEEILKRENIREDDAVRLLQRFGQRTIANPFELVEV